MADGFHADIEAGVALFGLVAHAGLVRVDEVILAVFIGREVGHDDIGSGCNGFLASQRVDSLVGRGSHHVDFGHHQSQDSYHLEREIHPFFDGRNLVGVLVQRCVGVGNEGPHADHGHVLAAEEEQVVGEVVERLEGQSHHDACACLVADLQQRVDAGQSAVEVVLLVAGMDFVVELLVRRLDAQQVAVGARFEPLAVGFIALLAQRQRYTQ